VPLDPAAREMLTEGADTDIIKWSAELVPLAFAEGLDSKIVPRRFPRMDGGHTPARLKHTRCFRRHRGHNGVM
jgi:hypothetical protein